MKSKNIFQVLGSITLISTAIAGCTSAPQVAQKNDPFFTNRKPAQANNNPMHQRLYGVDTHWSDCDEESRTGDPVSRKDFAFHCHQRSFIFNPFSKEIIVFYGEKGGPYKKFTVPPKDEVAISDVIQDLAFFIPNENHENTFFNIEAGKEYVVTWSDDIGFYLK